MELPRYTSLDKIDSPDDLKKLRPEELDALCGELRHFIIEQLSENPGHLGSSLGTVELTVALHYVYDTPYDKIVWDVGHQAYAHKILTGRRELFRTNRRLGGISGFPSMKESPYDAFGGGHASVSISAAGGMASASKIRGEQRKAVAVIGDGALTGGLAFEGLNNAGCSDADLLVILNDNDMSIASNVGALREYLLGLLTSRGYNRLKRQTWDFLKPLPQIRRLLSKLSDMVKFGLLRQSNLFESLNFRYFGPVDGHDVQLLAKTLRQLRDIPGPKLLHVLTVKGKGYQPAEADQSLWHAPGRFDPETGGRLAEADENLPPRYQDIFGRALLELARRDDRIVGVTPAMPRGCSMDLMMREMPGRCFDVGIAEGHAVTFSAGLAAEGMIPFCNIYSSFMQRAYDNLIHDVALQKLGVVMCLDRAGIVGEDGATHQGLFDLSYLLPIPNLIISSPLDGDELRDLMYTAKESGRPFVIRYPRGRSEDGVHEDDFRLLPIGKGRILREGNKIALLTLGPVGNAAARAAARAEAEGISLLHADLRYAKPLDTALLHDIGRRFDRVVTVEDGVVSGGVGTEIMRFFADNGYGAKVDIMGIGDVFVEHGTPEELYAIHGLDENGIYKKLTEAAASKASR